MTPLTERERQIVEWLRAMTASEWNSLNGDWTLPATLTIADAIEAGEPWKGQDNG